MEQKARDEQGPTLHLEEKFASNSAPYRTLFEAVNDAVFLHRPGNLEGKILAVNTVACQRLGYTEEELLGMSVADIDATEWTAPFSEVLKDRSARGHGHLETVHRAKDGRLIPVEISARRVDAGGEHLILSIARDVTERKNAEAALRASEERFHKAFRHAPVMMAITALETGAVLDVNQQFEALTGFKREELLGRTTLELGFFTSEERAWIVKSLREHGRISNYPLKHRLKDGVLMDCIYEAEIMEVDSRPCILSILYDVTERKRLDVERETIFHLLALLNSPGGLNDLVSALARFIQELTGCEAVGIRLREGADYPYVANVGLQDDFVKAEGRLCRASSNGNLLRDSDGNSVLDCMCGNVIRGRFNPALPFFTASGSFWTNCTSRLLGSLPEPEPPARIRNRCNRAGYESVALVPLKCSGQTLGLIHINDRRKGMFTVESVALLERAAANIAIALDQRMGQEALCRSEEQYRKLVEICPVGILVHQDGIVRFANPDAAASLGAREPGELIGQALMNLVHPDCRELAAARMEEVRRSASLPLIEAKFVRLDGRVVEVESAALQFLAGDPPRILTVFRDVTERKKAQWEREQLQVQLEKVQRMESIGRLAGGVAHDFNNLLTVINGYSSMILARMKEDNPVRASIEEIRKAGERASALVRQLLAFGQKQVLEPTPLSLNSVLGEMDSLLRGIMGEDIEIVTKIEPSLPSVLADRRQIERVIVNLAVNARDAMPRGGTLTLETQSRFLEGICALCKSTIEPGEYAELVVRDTGVGMDKTVLEHAFEPFFTTKDVAKNTGLGLATVQGIVIQSGGHVSVDSEPGRGTSFHVHLPAVEAAVEAPVPRSQLEVESVAGSETILLVEDQDEVRRFIATNLESLGYRVVQAADAKAALAECAARRVDLLLTDVIMPKMNGVEMAANARALQPGLKTLFISGYSDETHVRHGANLEGSMFLQKPFAPELLATKVREVLGSSLRQARILVVDDEEGVRGFLRAVLEGAGYTVAEAAEGKMALQVLVESPVDLVITDLVMPNQEGLETVRTVRRLRPSVGIIVISGAGGGAYLRMARPLGADATLAKPITPEVLLEQVSKVLQERHDLPQELPSMV